MLLTDEEKRIIKNEKERARWKARRDEKLIEKGIDPAIMPISPDGTRGKQINAGKRDLPDEFKYPKDGETQEEWYKRYRAEIARRSYEKHGERWKEGIRQRYKDNHEHCLEVRHKWKERNPHKQKEYDKRQIDKNPDRIEKLKAWVKSDPERSKALSKASLKNNPHMGTAYASKRRASERQQTPYWANSKEITKIFKSCSELTKSTGVIYHVDHIVPLRSKRASGLHIHSNLQIIFGEENLKKRAKLDEDFIISLMKNDWQKIK